MKQAIWLLLPVLVLSGTIVAEPVLSFDRLDESSAAASWLREFETVFPGLDESSFHYDATYSLRANRQDGVRLWREDDSEEDIAVIKSVAEVSPDGLQAVTIYRAQLYNTGSGWEPCSEPDSYIVILPVETWSGEVLRVTGTLACYYAAGWISGSSFIVVGEAENQTDFKYYLNIWEFDLGENIRFRFVGPVIPEDPTGYLLRQSWYELHYPHIHWAWE